MVPRVRVLEVGGSKGGPLGEAFFPTTSFFGTRGARGGTKRSPSESNDLFFPHLLNRGRGQKRIKKKVQLLVTGHGLLWESGGENLHTGRIQHSPTKGAWWLQNSSYLGGPQRFRAGDKIRSGLPVGLVAT